MTPELFEQSFGLTGRDRIKAGDGVKTGNFVCIVPQTDCTIATITIPPDFTDTNYAGETLAAGVPLYGPFTSIELSLGTADIYRTAKTRRNLDKVQ
jgi:hypothetical protein